MGIKQLNRFLTIHCSDKSISKRSLAEFRNKVLVVDTSIYLYRFAETNMVTEGFYNMISIFRKYRITPVFVFDGKPPIEKKELLEKRRCEKDAAEKIYNDLKQQLDELNAEQQPGDEPDARERKQEILSEMDTLKKRFVRIKMQDIYKTKELMTAYGTTFIESFGEADQLCAYLVRNNYAWACVSDDMDMFLYGCPRVIRHVSLVNHTGILYDTGSILHELNMSYDMFRDIMILSGTDYNIHQKIHLYDTMKWYNVYNNDITDMHFYDWLIERAGYVIRKDSLSKIREMFDLSVYEHAFQPELKSICSMTFQNKQYDKSVLRSFLMTDGFIFLT
jgi:hypothetical protein